MVTASVVPVSLEMALADAVRSAPVEFVVQASLATVGSRAVVMAEATGMAIWGSVSVSA